MKKFLRTFLVLCLCCCIVFSAAIPRAQAAALTTATVTTATAVAAGLVALGIGVGATDAAFNKLVDSLTAVAGSDTVPVWISETADGFVTYLQESFLGTLLAHCFDSGTLVASDGFSASHSISYPDFSGTVTGSDPFFVGFYAYDGVYRVVFFSQTEQILDFTSDSGSTSTRSLGTGPYGGYYMASSSNGTWLDISAFSGCYYFGELSDVFNETTTILQLIYIAENLMPGVSSVSTTDDLTLGSVGTSLAAPNYDDWRNNAIPVVPPVVGGGTAEEEDAVPVSFPGLDRPGLTDQTQSEAQAGVTPGTVVDEIVNAGADAGTDTGTIAGVINEIKALPASIAQAIADVFSPPAVSEAFQISLTDFFPFCIPFDLYNLLDALAAAPEAPVFNGVIPVPTFGQTYEIEVDLSPWDNVAALFRTLQLGLFIVGLALVTRERFLRS